jgi:hypothetical protein
MFTISSKGEIHLDIAEEASGRRSKLKCDITRGTRRKPGEDMWDMGNTSIGHNKALGDGHDDPFAVIFNPAEVASALACYISQLKSCLVEN